MSGERRAAPSRPPPALFSLALLVRAGIARAPSTYDHSTLPEELRHRGVYAADFVSAASQPPHPSHRDAAAL